MFNGAPKTANGITENGTYGGIFTSKPHGGEITRTKVPSQTNPVKHCSSYLGIVYIVHVFHNFWQVCLLANCGWQVCSLENNVCYQRRITDFCFVGTSGECPASYLNRPKPKRTGLAFAGSQQSANAMLRSAAVPVRFMTKCPETILHFGLNKQVLRSP